MLCFVFDSIVDVDVSLKLAERNDVCSRKRHHDFQTMETGQCFDEELSTRVDSGFHAVRYCILFFSNAEKSNDETENSRNLILVSCCVKTRIGGLITHVW